MIISGSVLIAGMLYFIVGLIRTFIKTAHLADNKKIMARNDDFGALKYILNNPTLGDIIFLPVQLTFCLVCFLVLLALKALSLIVR